MECLIQSFLESKNVILKARKLDVIVRYFRMKYKIQISREALKVRLNSLLKERELKLVIQN